MKDTYLIVDGNSLMHRAYHALPLMDANGVYTNAVYGFLSMLLKVIKEENVQYLSVCFDEHGPTFRHLIYDQYKAGRAETPPELRQQFETIRNLLNEMNVHQVSIQGWEADDLLGTLSLKGEEKGVAPLLLTGDRDALQLVGGSTDVLFTRKGISDTIRFNASRVYEEYGFTPEQVTDWKGLAGDASDHIPGIPGVGDKTAVRLLKEYGTLENTLEHAGEIKGKLGEKLREWGEQARFSKKLATIHRDAPIAFTLEGCILPDLRKSIPALSKLQLNQIIKRIEKQDDISNQEKNAEKKKTFIPLTFGTAEVLQSAETILEWIRKNEADQNICIYWREAEVTLAVETGKLATIAIGGDLLQMGLDPVEVLNCLMPVLEKGTAVVHDAKKWLYFLDEMKLKLPDTFAWDTQVGAYLLNPQEKSYQLKSLCAGLEENAAALCSLYVWQRNCIQEEAMLPLMKNVEMPLSFALFRMEKAGILIDREFLRDLGQQYTSEIEKLRKQVIEVAGGKDFNLNSPQQLGEVLFEQLHLPHSKKTSKGYSTSAEVLENLRWEAPEIIEPLLRYRQLAKLNGTYVEGLLPLADEKGRIHSHFDQVSTATGRLSSSEPNLQNIPVRTAEGKEIRQAFLPKEGWVLLDADYSQIELRLMAHFSGDQALLDAFLENEDIHARTASEIFDVPLEWVTPELRSRAKAVNFGIIYGISGFGLSKNTGVSQKEAREFIQKYFEKYPGVKQFMDKSVSDALRNGYAQTLMGRRRYIPELQSDKAPLREFGKRVAMNTPIQGTAADIIKMAMVKVDQILREHHLMSRMILQVHDELILECPPEEVEEATNLLRESMEKVIQLKVPLIAEIHTGKSWAAAK